MMSGAGWGRSLFSTDLGPDVVKFFKKSVLLMDWKIGIDMYTLLYIREITKENCVCSTEISTECSVVT